MSLTKYQQPANNTTYTSDKKVHGLYDMFYTTLSTLSSTDNFRYNFQLNDTTGTIVSTKTYPYTEGYGIFNTRDIIKPQITYTFQPSIACQTVTKCNTDVYSYNIQVNETNLGNVGATAVYNTCLGIRCKDENFNYTNHLFKGNSLSKFLTNFNTDLYVHPNQYHTVRHLNGSFKEGAYDVNYFSSAYEYVVKVWYKDGRYRRYKWSNPYYNVAYNGIGSKPQVSGAWLLEVGCGPYNLNIGRKYMTNNETGYLNPAVLVTGTIIDDTVAYYKFCAYTNGIKSEELYFIINCPADGYSGITFAWENIYGATDYYYSKGFNKEEVKISKNNYYKYNKQLVGAYMQPISYSGGEETFNVNTTDNYISNTDWLTETQAKQLSYMWSSENVFAQIGNTWYRIQLNDDSRPIPNNQGNSMYTYSISFRLSNKITI